MNRIHSLKIGLMTLTLACGALSGEASARTRDPALHLTCSEHATYQTNLDWPSPHWTDTAAVALDWGVHYLACVST